MKMAIGSQNGERFSKAVSYWYSVGKGVGRLEVKWQVVRVAVMLKFANDWEAAK